MLDGVLGRQYPLVKRKGLFQKIVGPELRRPDGSLYVGVSRYHYYRYARVFKLYLLQGLGAVHPRKPYIKKDYLRRARLQLFESLLGVGGGHDLVTFVFQDAGERVPYVLFIVDQHHGRLHTATAFTGSSITKRVPLGWLSLTLMYPLWSEIILLTMARPRPVPGFLVGKYGSKSLCFISAGMPPPVSHTSSLASFSSSRKCVSTLTMPSSSTEATALSIRLISTLFIWSLSISRTGSRWSMEHSSFTFLWPDL